MEPDTTHQQDNGENPQKPRENKGAPSWEDVEPGKDYTAEILEFLRNNTPVFQDPI